MKRWLLLILTVLLTAASLCLGLLADDYIIADFDSSAATPVSFFPGDAVKTLTVIAEPSPSVRDNNILVVDTQSTDSSVIRTVTALPDEPLDLSDYKRICASVFVDPASKENIPCFARITLISEDGKRFESISTLETGSWTEISADISTFMSRSTISAIEFGIIPDHIDSGIWDADFCLDSICATEPVNTALTDRFSFEDFVSGPNVFLSADKTELTFNLDRAHEPAFIEFPVASIPDAFSDTLRINLENNSTQDSFTVTLIRDEGISQTEITHKLMPTSDPYIYRIDISKPTEIQRIRLEIPGSSGSVTIRSIEFTSSYNSTPYITYGDVTECTLSPDKSSISIVGKLDREYVTEFAGTKLCLYSLGLSDDPHSFDYESEKPIATHGISTKFRFTVDAGDEGESFKFRKYVVMISTKPMVFVDTPTYISDPSLRSLRDVSDSPLSAGISASSAYTVTDSLSGASVVDIDLSKMAAPDRNGYVYTLEGKQYYFNKDYIDRLDRRLGAMSLSGVSVSLRILAGDEVYFGFQDPQVANEIRAAVEFLSARYLSDTAGKVDSFIAGKSVNSGKRDGKRRSMTECVNSYADFMRLIYLSASKSAGFVRVYASLDDVFEYPTLSDTPCRFDTVEFIQALTDYIEDEGYFPWGICIDTDSHGNENASPLLSVSDTDCYDELFALLSLKKDMRETPVMAVDHIDYTCTDDDFALFAAQRVASAAKSAKLSRYIIQMSERSPHTEDVATAIKALNGSDRDTADSFGISPKDLKRIRTVYTRSTGPISKLPFEMTGKYVYLDFNSYQMLTCLKLSHNAKQIKLVPMQTDMLAMRVDFERVEPQQPMAAGILCTDYSFVNTPIISLDISSSGLVKNTPLTLRLISESGIYTSETVLVPDTPRKVYADISELLSDGNLRAIELVINDPDCNSATLYIDNLTGYSEKYDDTELYELASGITSEQESSPDPVIVTIFVLVMLVLLSLVLILSLVSKKHDKADK